LLVTLFCSSCAWHNSSGQWEFKKIRHLQREILKNPNDYDTNYDLGVAYLKRGEKFSTPSTNWKKVFFQSAIAYLEEAIRIRPKSAEAHLALGEVLGNEKINDGFGAIKHTGIAEKLFERQNYVEGVELAKENRRVFSKKFFSFYLLGFSRIQIPGSSSVSSLALPSEKSGPIRITTDRYRFNRLNQ
jgi:tetratricopeptide (TPR) repeat protein